MRYPMRDSGELGGRVGSILSGRRDGRNGWGLPLVSVALLDPFVGIKSSFINAQLPRGERMARPNELRLALLELLR